MLINICINPLTAVVLRRGTIVLSSLQPWGNGFISNQLQDLVHHNHVTIHTIWFEMKRWYSIVYRWCFNWYDVLKPTILEGSVTLFAFLHGLCWFGWNWFSTQLLYLKLDDTIGDVSSNYNFIKYYIELHIGYHNSMQIKWKQYALYWI